MVSIISSYGESALNHQMEIFTLNILVSLAILSLTIHRVSCKWRYKPVRSDSSRKNKSKIYNKIFPFKASFSRK